MELIYKDKLLEAIDNCDYCDHCSLSICLCIGDNFRTEKAIVNLIKDTPAVDAVEVVRCKDCKWCFGDLDENNNAVFSCEQWNEQKTDPNGFCFAGVRREHNATD